MKKYVYSFKEGNKNMKNILGGKGANLAEMSNLGLPVPNGFTISTEVCNLYYKNNDIPKNIKTQIIKKLFELEKDTKKKLGDKENPLLLSVRSGARSSMPGMMDTILNLGMNDEVVETLYKKTKNKRFAFDSYRRFIMMYADVVKGVNKDLFENTLTKYKIKNNYKSDLDMTGDDFEKITLEYKKIYKNKVKEQFPSEGIIQLFEAIKSVFRSWNNERAIYYRKINDIPTSWGTAVNIQEMVFGNLGDNSATGVAFTRNPSTGENKLYGEFLINAQGEDLVSGVRTPEDIIKLKDKMPNIYKDFEKYSKKMEKHYRDMQDMEFTIEEGKLYILQTRNGKRTPEAMVKIATDLVKEGILYKDEAILMVDATLVGNLLHEVFDKKEESKAKVLGKGLASSPGATTGKICFDAKKISSNKNQILVRKETSAEDVEAMNKANGILTLTGGMTSHAAVVARSMGKTCICGADDFKINGNSLICPNGDVLKENDYISLNGTNGIVYKGVIKTEKKELSDEFITLLNWSKKYSKMKVRVNADNEKEASLAKTYGAEGIGLCRTEHMFFEEKRILNFRKMILSKDKKEREKALNKILPYQLVDFEKIFETMSGYPVIIRYLDPPLHEFLPKTKEEIGKLAKELNITNKEINERINELKEFNPMMGHRGIRLGITYPEIIRMQTTAVIEAALKVKDEGLNPKVEIMIPLVGSLNEFIYAKKIVEDTAKDIFKEKNNKISYKIGTMIEVPRACLIIKDLSKYADFYSFGTNDLTQMTYGFSRDDSSKFIDDYLEKNIISHDPFKTIDEQGVGKLIKNAVKDTKKTNKKIELGICGEHGGEVNSIRFFNTAKLDYVSCSVYRVPTAIIASAQAQICQKNNQK